MILFLFSAIFDLFRFILLLHQQKRYLLALIPAFKLVFDLGMLKKDLVFLRGIVIAMEEVTEGSYFTIL
jgi:hypothetical protein